MKSHLFIVAAALALASCGQSAQTANNEQYNDNVAQTPSATDDTYPSLTDDLQSDGERPSGETGTTDPNAPPIEPTLPQDQTTPP